MAPVSPLVGTIARVEAFFVLFRFVFLVVFVLVVRVAAPAAPAGDAIVAVVRGMWVSSLSWSFSPARSLRRRLAGGGEEDGMIAGRRNNRQPIESFGAGISMN